MTSAIVPSVMHVNGKELLKKDIFFLVTSQSYDVSTLVVHRIDFKFVLCVILVSLNS